MCASVTEQMKHNLSLQILLMGRSDYGDCCTEMFFVVACWSENDVLDAICEYKQRCVRICLLISRCVFEDVFRCGAHPG